MVAHCVSALDCAAPLFGEVGLVEVGLVEVDLVEVDLVEVDLVKGARHHLLKRVLLGCKAPEEK